MMYTLLKYADGTELTFSDIRKKENGEEYLIVIFERPTESGFDTLVFELPSYEILRRDGNFSDKEVNDFKTVVERGAPVFFKYARNGGLQSA